MIQAKSPQGRAEKIAVRTVREYRAAGAAVMEAARAAQSEERGVRLGGQAK